MSADNWRLRFFELAELVAGWSKDPSSKIGAVIVDNLNRIISTGFNGFAPGVKDTDERLNNREEKYKIILHAEENAILFSKQNLADCNLYVSGLPPCPHCASLIISSGIKTVFVKTETVMNIPDRWKDNINLSIKLFEEAGVIVYHVTEDGGIGGQLVSNMWDKE